MMVHQCHLIFPQAQMEMLRKIIFQKIVCWWVKLKFSSKSQGYHNQQKREIWWEKWAKVVILYHQRWTFVDQSIDFTKIQENSPATQQALPSNSKLWKLKLTNFPHWSLGFYGTKIKNEGVHQKLWWWSFHVRLKVVPPTWPKLYPGASRFLPRRHVLASAWRRRGAFPPVDITNVTPQVTNGFLLENKLANLTHCFCGLKIEWFTKKSKAQWSVIKAALQGSGLLRAHGQGTLRLIFESPVRLWRRKRWEKTYLTISWIRKHQHFRGQIAVSRCFYIMSNSWDLLCCSPTSTEHV